MSASAPSSASVLSVGAGHKADRWSVDSGYGSTHFRGDSSSAWSIYHDAADSSDVLALKTAYQQWRAANEARRTMPAAEGALAMCQAKLKDATARLNQLVAESQRPKTQTRLPQLFGGKKSTQRAHFDLVTEVFTDTLPEARTTKAKLEQELKDQQQRVDALKSVAKSLDAHYDVLKKHMESMPPSPSGGPESAAEVTSLEQKVTKVQAAYDDCLRVSEIWRRAEREIQAAHYHYRQALQDLEGVLNKGIGERLFSDEQGTELTYHAAVRHSSDAQKHFDECVRLFSENGEIFPEPPPEFRELQEVRLMQAAKLYDLRYGGKALQFGIKKDTKVMADKQIAVFGRLTDFAVWVQNYNKESVGVMQTMRRKRDDTRERLVHAWVRTSTSEL